MFRRNTAEAGTLSVGFSTKKQDSQTQYGKRWGTRSHYNAHKHETLDCKLRSACCGLCAAHFSLRIWPNLLSTACHVLHSTEHDPILDPGNRGWCAPDRFCPARIGKTLSFGSRCPHFCVPSVWVSQRKNKTARINTGKNGAPSSLSAGSAVDESPVAEARGHKQKKKKSESRRDGIGFPIPGACIENQEKHHKKLTFEEAFLAFLKADGVDYDPRFVFD